MGHYQSSNIKLLVSELLISSSYMSNAHITQCITNALLVLNLRRRSAPFRKHICERMNRASIQTLPYYVYICYTKHDS